MIDWVRKTFSVHVGEEHQHWRAQAELFATVMPSFPVWDLAGFIGSTLWLLWLVIIGGFLLR